MTNTFETMLALFNLGSEEITVILIVLMLSVVVPVVAIVALVTVFFRKKKSPLPPAFEPVKPGQAQSTQVVGRCPKCGAELKAGMPEGLCPACLLQHGIATEGGPSISSTNFTPPPLAELARLFPQLEILEIIGQGGMGAVYKARQPALDRFVALKILAPRSGGDLDFSGRFSREARALAKLSHPNIVGVYDFGQIQRSAEATSGTSPSTLTTTQSLSYFIMEFVDGPNLRQLEQAKKLTPQEALQIIPQICGALQFAHDEGIVHRDIKPENVLIDKKGRVKIADFGLAKILGQEADFRLTGARDVMGTPHYMAPEQVEKPQEVDHRADIYSLGVVFYEMLTGELPLGKFDPPSHKVQIDVRLDDVVLRSLANNPDRRYQNVSEIKTEVETISTSSAPKNAAPSAARFVGFAPGWEYKSPRTFFGLPLLHVSGGINPATGKANVSRGIFAFGQIAKGVYASGGRAYGLFSFGGISAGLISLGGIACGTLALGALAVGAFACGSVAAGAVGLGGTTLSVHQVHANYVKILPFFVVWACLAIGAVVLHIAVHAWARKRATVSPASDRPFTGFSELKLFGLALTPLLLATILLAVDNIWSKHNLATRQNGPVTAEFHYRVFECDASLVDQLIPVKDRKNGVQALPKPLGSSITSYARENIPIRTPGVIDIDSSFAPVDQRALQALISGAASHPGLLVDTQKVVSSTILFPGIPESWSYSQTEGQKIGSSLGAGYLGVRRNNGRLETRIECELRHTFEPDPLAPINRLASHFLFQDRVPRSGALVFLVPFVRNDNSRHYLVAAYQISATSAANVITPADADPANLEAPAPPKPPMTKSSYVAGLAVLKTVVLARATNNWSDASNKNGTLTLWTDSELRPGESLLTLVKQEDGGWQTNRSTSFIHQRSDKTNFSTSFSWYFGGAFAPNFGQSEAEEAVAQLNEHFTNRSTTLVRGKPMKLFSVTNSSGAVMIGSIDFERTLPAPLKPGTRPEAVLRIRHFTSMLTSPGVDYAATVPPGYALRAIANIGEGYIFSPAGPSDYHSGWIYLPEISRPPRRKPDEPQPFNPPTMQIESSEQRELERNALEDQFHALQDRDSIAVVLGEPRQMFSITNGAGEVFRGFIELVGPETGGPARSAGHSTRASLIKNSKSFEWKDRKLSNTNLQAIVHIHTVAELGIRYSAELPLGYILRATASTGTVITLPNGDQYASFWNSNDSIVPPPHLLGPGDAPPVAPERIEMKQIEARRMAMEAARISLRAQLKKWEDLSPISILPGQPKQLFSVTNVSGGLWQGFLELAPAEADGTAGNIDPITGRPPASMNAQPLSPEEQVIAIEAQRSKFRLAAPERAKTPPDGEK